MDGTRLMGRWADLTGEPHPLSTRTHILQFAEEFRGSLGHIGMLGIKHYILPFTGGVNNTAYEQTRAISRISTARARRAASPASSTRTTTGTDSRPAGRDR